MANTGWLPTDISAHARRHRLVQPVITDIAGDGISVIDGPPRRLHDQLEGRRTTIGALRNDGTPDRVLSRWTVRASPQTWVTLTATHERAGTATTTLQLTTS